MSSRKTAERLISAKTNRERAHILSKTAAASQLEIAHQLKNICYEVWTSAPTKAQKTALALATLARINPAPEIEALALWVAGIGALTRGRLENAVAALDRSASVFRRIRQEHEAAHTQVAKLIVLALLGKYPEAVKTGKAALKVFEKYGDALAAGKIEKNLGNIIARQNEPAKSVEYYLAARERFLKLGDVQELTMCETNLANMYTELNRFHKAEEFYRQALERARAAQMFFIEAEIEASMGNLAMFRGRYAEALRFLELSRQKFEELGFAHRSVTANLEIAEIYETLNLADEAFEIYASVAEKLRRLKLQGEEAKARMHLARVALTKKDFAKARKELKKSAALYISEKNPGGLAEVKLAEANLELTRGDFAEALIKIREAGKLLARSPNLRSQLFAKWMHGEILRRLGRFKRAEKMLVETYDEALGQEQTNLAQACLNSLGSLFLQKRDARKAENYFGRAVRMIEQLRAPLAAEQFRMAFLSDKLAPFENLAKIYLSESAPEKAFLMVEKARARTLSESLSGNFPQSAAGGGADSKLSKKLEDAREELNWFYSRLNRAAAGDVAALQKETKKREKQIADLMRQIESTRIDDADGDSKRRPPAEEGELEDLQKRLGSRRAIVEYVNFDGAFGAFVVTGERVDFVPRLAAESEILALLEGLRFQFGALRFGTAKLGGFLDELKRRADFYLQKLYEKLLLPLEDRTGTRDLVIVPVGAAHYIPFHALRRADEKYLIETREVVHSPSASVWRQLAEKPARAVKNALLVGFADENIPLVDREIETLREIFPRAQTLTGAEANFSNYRRYAPDFDLLHLACHGQFRPENPLFSSLHLADGFVTVRDICAQRLEASLVTLSACETGLNKIYAGNEILGLARGFLAVGVRSLVLSLWTVNDETTVRLMKDFYINLQRGENVSASLRLAQINFIENNSHPYFWSPFTVIGK